VVLGAVVLGSWLCRVEKTTAPQHQALRTKQAKRS